MLQATQLSFFPTEIGHLLQNPGACESPMFPFVEFESLALGRIQLEARMQDSVQRPVLRGLLENHRFRLE